MSDFGAWGIFSTCSNLLPEEETDGGHIVDVNRFLI